MSDPSTNADLQACSARFHQEGAAYDRALLQLLREILWAETAQSGDLAAVIKALPVIVSARRYLAADEGELSDDLLNAKIDRFLGPRRMQAD